ncbi:MAG: endonuclease domain-containing protein [Terricaulis sp.]
MTPAETALWYELRRNKLPGTHFRRQTPMGPFIADFACHRAKLIIEVEGGAHEAPDVALRDAERRAWIEGRGYYVLRVANARVLQDVRAVAREIVSFAELRLRDLGV